MTRRRAFKEREVLETLLGQGVLIPCYRCKVPMLALRHIEREHLLEVALEGPDEPGNCVYSHKDCHAVITDGAPATTAGSSKNRIAKAKRFSKGKMAVNKGAKKKLTAWSKRVRPWPKGRAMQSKGFVKI